MSWLFITFSSVEGCETARRWLVALKREGRAEAISSFGVFKSRARWDPSPMGHCLLMLQIRDLADLDLCTFLERCTELPSHVRHVLQEAPAPRPARMRGGASAQN